MDIFYDALKKSVEHLSIIDKILSTEDHPNKDNYLKIKKTISELNVRDPDSPITDLLYVGGKKGTGSKGYHRQMLLNDIIEYILLGRGYYYVNDDPQRKKTFIELILNVINLLMIMDSLTVQPKIRKKVLDELKSLGPSFFKEPDMNVLHDALSSYDGDLGFDTNEVGLPKLITDMLTSIVKPDVAKKKLDDYYDSILPKTGGGLWNELIVFFYLLRRTSVFIIPLLLTQRILSKDKMLKPPDYLVIDKHKQLYGIEVGGGKEGQSSNFASDTGSKMLTTENTNVPPRCPICGEWILLCPKVIEDCCDIQNNPLLRINKEVRCAHECNKFNYDDVLKGICPYIQYHGEVSQNTAAKSKQKIKFASAYHYHYSCILKIRDSVALEKIKKQNKSKTKWGITVLKTDYPYVSGIANLEKLDKSEIVCYGKYDIQKDRKNCELCDFKNKCQIYTNLMNFAKKGNLNKKSMTSLKDILS